MSYRYCIAHVWIVAEAPSSDRITRCEHIAGWSYRAAHMPLRYELYDGFLS